MILNVIGKNYQQMGDCLSAEDWFIRSTHRLPGRIYPYYLLAKLYAEPGFRQPDKFEKMKRMEEKRIPSNIDWDDIDSIATEARQKFKLINPETIGQASRISGVNPADISILMVYLEGKSRSISKNQEKES